MKLNDGLDDGKSQSGLLRQLRVAAIRAVQAIADPRQVLLSDAATAVLYPDQNRVVAGLFDRHYDFPAA